MTIADTHGSCQHLTLQETITMAMTYMSAPSVAQSHLERIKTYDAHNRNRRSPPDHVQHPRHQYTRRIVVSGDYKLFSFMDMSIDYLAGYIIGSIAGFLLGMLAHKLWK